MFKYDFAFQGFFPLTILCVSVKITTASKLISQFNLYRFDLQSQVNIAYGNYDAKTFARNIILAIHMNWKVQIPKTILLIQCQACIQASLYSYTFTEVSITFFVRWRQYVCGKIYGGSYEELKTQPTRSPSRSRSPDT